jgi:hypothetical protein
VDARAKFWDRDEEEESEILRNDMICKIRKVLAISGVIARDKGSRRAGKPGTRALLADPTLSIVG